MAGKIVSICGHILPHCHMVHEIEIIAFSYIVLKRKQNYVQCAQCSSLFTHLNDLFTNSYIKRAQYANYSQKNLYLNCVDFDFFLFFFLFHLSSSTADRLNHLNDGNVAQLFKMKHLIAIITNASRD